MLWGGSGWSISIVVQIDAYVCVLKGHRVGFRYQSSIWAAGEGENPSRRGETLQRRRMIGGSYSLDTGGRTSRDAWDRGTVLHVRECMWLEKNAEVPSNTFDELSKNRRYDRDLTPTVGYKYRRNRQSVKSFK